MVFALNLKDSADESLKLSGWEKPRDYIMAVFVFRVISPKKNISTCFFFLPIRAFSSSHSVTDKDDCELVPKDNKKHDSHH